MNIELRDLITGLSVIVAVCGMLLVNRNAKRALRPAMENADLARIRDLRSELADARHEMDNLKGQIHQLNIQVRAATEDANNAHLWRMEALRYARMPGMDLDTWLARFDQAPPELNGRP